MSEEFEELRATYLPLEPTSIPSSGCQYRLATDIFDKEQNDLARTVGTGLLVTTKSITISGLIVMTHHMQASDVSHTMQHWTFTESGTIDYSLRCAQPTKHGRMGVDPSTFCTKASSDFDNYIIPLLRKAEGL
jgi:hypothetical protein